MMQKYYQLLNNKIVYLSKYWNSRVAVTPVRGKDIFWKTDPYKNWFQKMVGRKDGFYVIWMEIDVITGHYDLPKLISLKKYDFVHKSWRTIRYTNNSRKNKSTKNVILVVNREETLGTAGTLWSPDDNCFFTFHEQIHRFAKKLR